MSIAVESGMPCEEVSGLIAAQFAEGATHVHLREVPFVNLDNLAQVDYIRRVSQGIGELSLSDGSPGSDVWRLDTTTSPSAKRIPYHSDNPFYGTPEQIVSFWNVRSSPQGGENVLLLVEDIFDLGSQNAEVAELIEELQSTPVDFANGADTVTAPILDGNTGTIRFDRRYVGPGHSSLVDRFTALLEGRARGSHTIKLAEGDVLFFDNRRLLHARETYVDLGRISFRTRIKELTGASAE